MAQQGLHYRRFLYYFEDNYGGLPKIMKDCPHIGPIRSRPANTGELFYLSNIEEDTLCPKAEILSVVPKIHRRYGLNEAHIIYQFETNIKRISLYNYRITGMNMYATEPIAMEAFRNVY